MEADGVGGRSPAGMAKKPFDFLATSAGTQVIVDAALAAVITMGDDGVINGWGARAEEMFGWSSDEALGAALVELIVPPRYREAHRRGLAGYRRTKSGPVLGEVIELSALRRNGEEFPVEVRISPAAVVDEVTVFVAFVFDIAQRKDTEERLARASEETREAKDAMDNFVSMIVHELRQPLTVACGYGELVSDGAFGEIPTAAQRPLRAVCDKVVEAMGLVDDILLATKLAGGDIATETRAVDVVQVVESAVIRAEPRAALSGGSIRKEFPSQPVTVLGDPQFIERVLDNLLSNAINYSHGAADVVVSVRAGSAPLVAVRDHGAGIPIALRERIFERCTRGTEGPGKPGSGLGLYISRELAKRQGGALDLEWSEPGVGSEFCLRLAPYTT